MTPYFHDFSSLIKIPWLENDLPFFQVGTMQWLLTFLVSNRAYSNIAYINFHIISVSSTAYKFFEVKVSSQILKYANLNISLLFSLILTGNI